MPADEQPDARDALIARLKAEPIPLYGGQGEVALIRVDGSDADICEAARHTSQSGKSDDRTLIRYLLRHEHGSPFEFAGLLIRFRVPVFVARQWVRHRIGIAWNEESGRYSELKADALAVAPGRMAGAGGG